jgi:hypothetical protein
MQVRFLRKRLEVHLLGNHLFANAKALVFAGLYFSGDEAEESIDSLAVELHPLAYNMKCTEVAIFVELGRIRNSVSILLSI